MRLNVEKKEESFTFGELDKVARDCADDASMQRVIGRVRARVGPFTPQNIIDAGSSLDLGYAAAAVLEELRANRRRDVVRIRPLDYDDYVGRPYRFGDGDSDTTITVAELYAALRHAPAWVKPVGAVDAAVEWIVKHIHDHREPDWKPGDVVKDADGRFWKRTWGGRAHSWASFDSAVHCSFDTPRRPLEKMS